jgi:hypothetical protein
MAEMRARIPAAADGACNNYNNLADFATIGGRGGGTGDPVAMVQVMLCA